MHGLWSLVCQKSLTNCWCTHFYAVHWPLSYGNCVHELCSCTQNCAVRSGLVRLHSFLCSLHWWNIIEPSSLNLGMCGCSQNCAFCTLGYATALTFVQFVLDCLRPHSLLCGPHRPFWDYFAATSNHAYVYIMSFNCNWFLVLMCCRQWFDHTAKEICQKGA